MRIDKDWDPRKAYARAHARRASEKLEGIECASCGHGDHAWVPVEPPAPGMIWAWPCPKCHGILLRLSDEQSNGPDFHPEQLPYVRGDWQERMIFNLSHEPVLIRSRKHYEQVLKERGVMNMHGVGGDRRDGQDLWSQKAG